MRESSLTGWTRAGVAMCLGTALVAGLVSAADGGGESAARDREVESFTEEEINRLLRDQGLRRAQARDNVVAAERAIELGEYERARRLLEGALALDPANAKARELLERMQEYLPARPDTPAAEIAGTRRRAALRAEAMRAEIENLLAVARAKYEAALTLAKSDQAANLSRALDLFSEVNDDLRRVRLKLDALGAGEYSEQAEAAARDLSEKLGQVRSAVAERHEEALRTQAIEEAEAQREQVALREAALRREMLSRAREHAAAKEYAVAEMLAREVLRKHPGDAEVQGLLAAIREQRLEYEHEKVDRSFEWSRSRHVVEGGRDMVQPRGRITYPEDWEEIERRDVTMAETRVVPAWEQEILRKLEAPISFDFVEQPLEDVLKTISQITGVNIIPPRVTSAVTEPQPVPGMPGQPVEEEFFPPMEAGLGPEIPEDDYFGAPGAGEPGFEPGAMTPSELAQIPVTLKVDNMRAALALKWILTVTGADLDYEIRDEAIHVAPGEQLKGEWVTKVYDVSDLLTPVRDSPSGADISSSPTQTGDDDDDDDDDDDEEDTMSLEEILVRMSPGEWGPARGDMRRVGENILSIRQTERVHDLIEETLEQLRETQAIQISILARYIVVEQNFWEEFNSYFPEMANILHDESKFGPTVGGGAYPNWPWGNALGGGILGTPFSPPSLADAGPAGWGEDYNWLSADMFNSYGPTADAPNAGLWAQLWQAGYLGNFETQWVVQMLKESEHADQVFAPHVLAHNNRRAVMTVQTEVPYISGYSSSEDLYTPEVSSVGEGVAIEIVPTVSADRRYITLNFRLGIQKIREILQVEGVEVVVGGGPAGSLPIELPTVWTNRDGGTATFPDGGSIMVTTIATNEDARGEGGVPILSDVPVVGRLFSGRGFQKERETILLFLNGEMVLLDEEERKLTQ